MFEITQNINDDPLKICPESGQAVTRIISGGGGVVYKGTGWYITDYKNGKSGKKGSAETKSEPSKNKKKDSESGE